jgi:hypothetical protein
MKMAPRGGNREVDQLSETKIGDIPTTVSILTALLIFLGLIEILTVLFSLVGVIISRVVALGVLGISTGLAGAYFYRFLRHPVSAATAGPGILRLPALVKSLSCLAALIYGSLWLLAYALPDFSYDGLWYHIPAIHFWGLAGRVHWIAADLATAWDPLIDNCLNGFPKGVELFTFILIRATGITRLANTVNLPFLPLGVLGVVALSRTLGANRNFSLLAGTLFVLVPVNIGQAVTSYVDTATAAVYIAAFALLAETLIRIRRGELFWRGLPALGAAAGLAMGAKTPGVVFPPVIALLLAGSFLAPETRRHFLGGKAVFRSAGFILIFLLIAILVGGYWPIRNYIRTGNPINPVGVEIAGKTIFPDHSWPNQFHSPYPPGTEEWPQVARVLSNWLFNFRDWWPRTTYTALDGGLGIIWIFGSLPALVWLLAATIKSPRSRKIIRHPAIFLTLTFFSAGLFFLMPPHHNHLARYTIWLYGVGLPAFVLVGEKVWTGRRFLLRLISRGWVVSVVLFLTAEGVATCLYNLESTYRYWDDWQNPPPIIYRLWRTLSQPYPSGYQSGSLMARLLSGRQPAALGPLRDRRVLILGRLAEGEAFGRRKIFFLSQETAENRDELWRFLADRDVRFIIWDIEVEVPDALAELILLRESAAGGLHLLVVNHRLVNLPEYL